MRSSKLTRAILAGVLVPPMVLVVGASAAIAQPPGNWQATALTPQSRIEAQKSPTSRLAQTDRTLLGRTDSTPVDVMVKLDYDAMATYAGGINGFVATSPSVTGKELDGKSAAEQQYGSFVAARESAIVKEMAKRVPGMSVHQALRTVYGGVAIRVPANRIDDLLKVRGVVAVQRDELLQPLTDASPHFIGADTIYPSLGGTASSGKGIIFGSLDTGAWPEHPSLADQGNLPAPPPKADGTPRTCNFGDNPLTPANDPFVCNHKLIGGAPFLATYLSNPSRAANEPFHTARDSNGHGTHTSTTVAGNQLASAPVLGVERGPLNGIAPGAWVSVYKVCGILGCFSSDSAAAVQQAILDGVKVINFSISGGTQPFADAVELAFLDAYAAGVFVAASAGNNGPGAGTVNHLGPWVTTVAASTQKREFDSTLTLHGTGSNTLTLVGASLTAGVGPLPVVRASSLGGYSELCGAPAPAGSFAGKIVACARGGDIGRVDKGFNVLQGGAAGMILYNPTLADVETDNHWLPAVHLPDGTSFLAFMAANPSVTGSFTAGAKVTGPGDIMAAFSSRGPGGLGIKPDITAPGVQVLAGHTPFRESITGGPPGEIYQAIAGTSMSSPHIAGSAILLRALRPSWTPGQTKSALMTTAEQDVVKENGVTPADPFDYGSGRVNLRPADNPVLTFDETAVRMAALGNNPLTAVDLNLPSINVPVLPGSLTTIRTAKNITNKSQPYHVTASAPAGSSITVTPSVFSLNAGQSIALSITIASSAPTGQYFGEVVLHGDRAGVPNLHLPVAFVPQQGAVSLTSACSPSSVAVGGSSTCTINAKNNSPSNTTADFATTTNAALDVTGATNATVVNTHLVTKTGVSLPAAAPGVPSVAPGSSPGGFIPLSLFGVAPISIGDETIINFNTPAFNYAGESFNRLAVDSNGYVVIGGGTAQDNNCCNLTQIPDPTRPNNVLAPFWTDLDGTGAPGIFIATLTDGVNTWIVVEWQVNVFGTNSNRHFQTWIRIGGVEDITFAYDPGELPADPFGQDYLVGAENRLGTGGDQEMPPGLPTQDLRVTSTAATPGGEVTYTVTVQAASAGTGTVTTSMTTPVVPGVTVVTSNVNVTPTSGSPLRKPQ